MIEKENIHLEKILHFDKRKEIKDKINEKPAKILLTFIILWCNFT